MAQGLSPPRPPATSSAWHQSGYHLLATNDDGRLVLTDAYLHAYLSRPELLPPAEACPQERALHASLLEAPARPVSAIELDALADPDARHNWRHFLHFRDHLMAHETLENGYLALFARDKRIAIPPLFIDQLVHVLVQHILADCADPFRWRAGELLFREQKLSLQHGAMLLADAETVEMYAMTGGFGSLGQLLVENRSQLKSVDLDVLNADNAAVYWPRSDAYDTVLDIAFTKPGLDALCRLLEAWIGHFLFLECSIQPVQSISDDRWSWHVGLDSGATALLNKLYAAKQPTSDELRRLLVLFRLDIKDASALTPPMRGKPIYAGLCSGPNDIVKIKPQNLLVGLPLVQRS
ncbi:MAG: DUF6352 family protein [Geminicoccaceae bacterium]